MAAPEDPAALEFIEWLFESAGLDGALYRSEPLVRRIPACLRALGVPNLEKARQILQKRPGLVEKAIDVFLIGVSGIFRDASVFEALEADVLPDLLRSRPGLRVWSAGCSTGEELFSVAVLLAECGAFEGSSFIGTDCREAAVRSALEGIVRVERGMELPAAARKHVVREWDGTLRIVPRIRSRIRFVVEDVLQRSQPGTFDLILCRNLAIYLGQDAASHLWKRLSARLSEGGCLVTGKAEQIRIDGLVRLGPSLYRRMREDPHAV